MIKNKKLKVGLIAAAWTVFILIMALGGCGDSSSHTPPGTAPEISGQETPVDRTDSSEISSQPERKTPMSQSSVLRLDLPDQDETSTESETITESSVESGQTAEESAISDDTFDPSSVPAYTGVPYANVHDRKPYFSDEALTTKTYIDLSDPDSLGRCGAAMACFGEESLPTEERGSIGSVKPTGWHTVKYDGIDGIYLYNRCHLLGFQLSGLNAEERNLITGTRYMNVEGMEPFENQTADYIKASHNHVVYRVTPIFTGNNLLADGVLMEAKSVEDNGMGLMFCVYCYNVQPGIEINYATGDSSGPEFTGSDAEENKASQTAAGTTASENTNGDPAEPPQTAETTAPAETQESSEETPALNRSNCKYVINVNPSSNKFHLPSCSSVDKMSESNTVYTNEDRDTLISEGYQPCKRCNP